MQLSLVMACCVIGLIGCDRRLCRTQDLTLSQPELRNVARAFESTRWVTEATVCSVGAYTATAPAIDPASTIWLATDGHAVLTIQDGLGISVFNSVQPHELILTLQDHNGDGIYDRISYPLFDEHGHLAGEILDMNLDGEIDVKVQRVPYRWNVRIAGRWMPVEKRGGVSGVVIDGNWKPVSRDDAWNWHVQE